MKQHTIDNMRESIVVNQETGQPRRFCTMTRAKSWCKEKNHNLDMKGMAPRFVAYPADNMPESYMSRLDEHGNYHSIWGDVFPKP